MNAFLPGLYLLSLIDCHRRFLNSCKYTMLTFIGLTIGTIIHYFLCYHHVMNLRMGITGVGISGVVMNFVIFTIQHGYAYYFIPEIREASEWPGKEVFSLEGAKSYMRLGIPSIGLQSLDWWIFESMMIISGTFGVLQQASQIILMNIVGGLCRVGNGLD